MSTNFVSAPAVKSFDAPDRKWCPDKTEVDLVIVDDHAVARLILAPGWRWSQCIKPLEKTASCQHHHLGYCLSGVLKVETTDGARCTIMTRDTYTIPPGHDAWVAGSEPFVAVEFLGASSLASPGHRGLHTRG